MALLETGGKNYRGRRVALVLALSAIGLGSWLAWSSLCPIWVKREQRIQALAGNPSASMAVANQLLAGTSAQQAEAPAFLQRAAVGGRADAALVLGKAYADGALGLPRQPSIAKPLLVQAAAGGQLAAYATLGRLAIQNGQIAGRDTGCEYLYQSAQTGDQSSMKELLVNCNGVQIHAKRPSVGAISVKGAPGITFSELRPAASEIVLP
jgi:hypothetical protein